MSEPIEETEITQPLSDKHQACVDKYLIHLNRAKAYQDVYKCSDEVAYTAGARLFRNVHILDAIEVAMEKRSKRCQVSQDQILMYWYGIVFGPEEKVHLETVQVKGKETLDSEDSMKTYKAPERFKASIEIAKHLGMYPSNKIDVNAQGGITFKFEEKEDSVL